VRESRRFLGLELSGAKSERTAVAALEFYPKEKKIFLLEVFDRIGAGSDSSGDEALLEVLHELRSGVAAMGVNVPLTLPPCLACKSRSCTAPGKCSNPASRWMRSYARRATRGQSKKAVKARQITPYTQRPVELWMRHHVLPNLPEPSQFEIDEAMGGTKAPLTARMNFLQRCLGDLKLKEVWPKLTIATLAPALHLSRRTLASYRHLEQGAHCRAEILDALAHHHGVFIYERDQRKLASSLAAFDAFFCAYTALISDNGQCHKPPTGFPVASGWVEWPR
jgi:hypothetical protein